MIIMVVAQMQLEGTCGVHFYGLLRSHNYKDLSRHLQTSELVLNL